MERIRWSEPDLYGSQYASGEGWTAVVKRAAGSGWEAYVDPDPTDLDVHWLCWPEYHDGCTGKTREACKRWVRRTISSLPF